MGCGSGWILICGSSSNGVINGAVKGLLYDRAIVKEMRSGCGRVRKRGKGAETVTDYDSVSTESTPH